MYEPLKIRNCHNAKFVAPCGTVRCRYDNLRCWQRRQNWHHDNSQFSMLLSLFLSLLVLMAIWCQVLICKWNTLKNTAKRDSYGSFLDVLYVQIVNYKIHTLLCFVVIGYWSICLFPHDDVIKWKHFPRYWPFVRGIHRSPVNFPHKRPVTWSFDVFFHLPWINNREAGDLRRYRAHCDVIVMLQAHFPGTGATTPFPLSQWTLYIDAMNHRKVDWHINIDEAVNVIAYTLQGALLVFRYFALLTFHRHAQQCLSEYRGADLTLSLISQITALFGTWKCVCAHHSLPRKTLARCLKLQKILETLDHQLDEL